MTDTRCSSPLTTYFCFIIGSVVRASIVNGVSLSIRRYLFFYIFYINLKSPSSRKIVFFSYVQFPSCYSAEGVVYFFLYRYFYLFKLVRVNHFG